MILQKSTLIDKSAVFLFQQTLIIKLINFGFNLTFLSVLFIRTFIHNDDIYYVTIRPTTVLVIVQQIFFCSYIALRYYLTYRYDGTIIVFFSYKFFYFIMIILINFGIIYGSGENGSIIAIVSNIALGVMVFFLKIEMLRKSADHLPSKIKQYTTWIYILMEIPFVIAIYVQTV